MENNSFSKYMILSDTKLWGGYKNMFRYFMQIYCDKFIDRKIGTN